MIFGTCAQKEWVKIASMIDLKISFFFVVDFVDEMTAKRGFPASYFSGQHDESLLFRNPVLQVLESFLVSWAEVKEVRDRG